MIPTIKLVVGVVLGILLIGGLAFYDLDKSQSPIDISEQEVQVYQGPVPLGYDLEHFRLTGETISLEVKE